MIFSCSSAVILISLGRQSPLLNTSAPTSTAFTPAHPFPSFVTKLLSLYKGWRCIGFQIGLDSIFSFYNVVLTFSELTLSIASTSIIIQLSQKFGSEHSRYGFILTGKPLKASLYFLYILFLMVVYYLDI